MASISPSSSSMTGSEVADGFALPAVKSSGIRQEIVRVWLRSALRHTGARCLRHQNRPDDPPPLCAHVGDNRMPDYSIETDPLRLVVRAGNTEWEITAPNGKMVVREYYPGDRMVEHRTTDIPLPRAALVEFALAVLAGEDASGP